MEEGGGLNLYAFVFNSPIDKWDLFGLKCKCLTISVANRNWNYESFESLMSGFLKAWADQANFPWVGHSWITLQESDDSEPVVYGQTGEERTGIEDNFAKLFLKRIIDSHDNPISAFFEDMNDGSLTTWTTTPTYSAEICDLPTEKWNALKDYIEKYNFKSYALTGNNCTYFAGGAGIAAGLSYSIEDIQKTINIPETFKLTFVQQKSLNLWISMQNNLSGKIPQTITLRKDNKYKNFTVATPDALRSVLEKLVGEGTMKKVETK